MKLAGLLVVSAILGASVFAATASASHVQCGDTITVDTLLDSDVVCSTPTTSNVGVFIGAGDVTLHLGHHTIRGPNNGEGVGVVTSGTVTGGFPNVQVRGGTIEGFSEGVSIHGHDSVVQGLSVSGINGGIFMQGDRNTVMVNDIAVTREVARYEGVRVEGDNAHVTRNTITGKPPRAIWVSGDNPRVAVNAADTCDPAIGTDGIVVGEYTGSAVVAQNQVTGCPTGVDGLLVSAAAESAGGARIRRNVVTGFVAGLRVDDPAALIWRNTANGNGDTGILISKPNNVVQENTANDNGINGINAPVGTIDGGGNVATGNGGQDCINVTCTSG